MCGDRCGHGKPDGGRRGLIAVLTFIIIACAVRIAQALIGG